MRTLAMPPRHFNPIPRFGLQPPKCRMCSNDMGENPIVDLGGGVLAKFGLCDRCLSYELEEREYWGEAEAVRQGWLTYADEESAA